MAGVSAYDEALAASLDGGDEDLAELRERLLSGGASGDDRRAARERMDEKERRIFELAHPNPPTETAQELDAGELEIERADLEDKKAFKDRADEIRERLAEALDEGQPVESLVALKIRVSAPEDR